jgi:hypothetical protein
MKNTSSSSWWPFAFLAIVVIGIWLTSPVIVNLMSGATELAGKGQFGDSYGALNALFSGLAFAGLGYAIYLQRQELAETREGLKVQEQESVKQFTALAHQRFENTFFELLRLHNEIVNSIELRKSSDSTQVVAKGRKCFKTFYNRFLDESRVKISKMPANNQVEILNRIEVAYATFFEIYENDVGHYFRSLYNIVKFVNDRTIEDKRIYTNLVRAQLSSFELKLLFYNCLSSLGKEKFKPMIEEYSFLKSMNKDNLLHGECDLDLYKKIAFNKLA